MKPYLKNPVASGYTKYIIAWSYNGEYELHLMVRPDTDLDDYFKAYDRDNQEYIYVHGWLFEVEDGET